MQMSARILFAGLFALVTLNPTLALVVEREFRPLITPAPVVRNLLQERDVVTWAYVSGDTS